MPAFYLLMLTSMCMGTGQNVWITFQIPAMVKTGFPLVTAGILTSVYGFIQIPIRLVLGYWGDSIGRRRLTYMVCVLQPIGLIAFSYITPDRLWLFPLYYLTYAIGHAGWVICNQTLMADYFGTRRLATIRGFNQILLIPISMAIPFFVGTSVGMTGSYHFAFLTFGLIGCTGILWFSLIRRPMLTDQLIATPMAAENPAKPT